MRPNAQQAATRPGGFYTHEELVRQDRLAVALAEALATIAGLQGVISALQATIADHEARLVVLEP